MSSVRTIFCVFFFIVVDCYSAPCPQFLPVAVRLESPPPEYLIRTPYTLKTRVRVKDDKENTIDKNPVIGVSLIEETSTATTTTKNAPQQSAATTTEALKTGLSQAKKRRGGNRRKDSKKFIFDQNTLWALRTINDKPAQEVLVTDKASVARDLKDSTESSVVTVQKLDEKKTYVH